MSSTSVNSAAIGRGTLWSFLDNTARQFLALLVFLVTARFVSVEAFGIMAVSLLVVEAFKQTVIDSVGTALVSTSKPDNEDYNAGFIIILLTSITSAIIVYLGSDFLAKTLGNEDISSALKLISLLLASIGLTRTHEAWLSKNLKFKILALRSIIAILLGGGVGIFMAVKGFGLIALVAQQLTITFTSTLLLWISTPWRPRFKTSRCKIIRLIRFAKHVMVTGATGMINTQSDIFFSSYYLGDVATGIYNSAKRITTALNLALAASLKAVALPALSNMQDEHNRTSHAFLKAVLFTSMLITPIYSGVAFASVDLISLLLGEKWIAAAPILSILTISSFLAAIGQYNYIVMLIKNKPHWQSALMTLFAITNIVFMVIFARYGLEALAWAITARALILFPIMTYAALHLLNIPFLSYIKKIFPSLLSASIMYGVLVLMKSYISSENTILNLIGFIFIGAIIYFISYGILDRKSLKQFLDEAKIIIKG